MPNQIDFLSVSKMSADDLIQKEREGNEITFPKDYEEAKSKYLSVFGGNEEKMQQYYNFAKSKYNEFRAEQFNQDRENIYSTHSSVLNARLGLPQRNEYYDKPLGNVSVKTPFLMKGGQHPFELNDQDRFAYDRDFFIDSNGKKKPIADRPQWDPYTIETDEKNGTYLQQHSKDEDLQAKEVMSTLGPSSYHSYWLASAFRGLLNGTIMNVADAAIAYPAETIDDIYDAFKYGEDKPGTLESFAHKIQNLSQFLTIVNKDEAQGTFDNANSFIYQTFNGLGSTLQAVGASYLFGGTTALALGERNAEGRMVLSAANQKIVNTMSLAGGLSAGSLVMGDAFRKQAAQMGIPDIDAAVLSLLVMGMTGATEGGIGGNVFENAYGRSLGQREAKEEIAKAIEQPMKEMGLSSFNAATAGQKEELKANILKSVGTAIARLGRKWKDSATSTLTGSLEEGSEELVQQVLQNAIQAGYDTYKKFNNTDPNLAAGHGLFGSDFTPGSLMDQGLSNFVVGALAGGIAGKVMGHDRHQEKMFADYFANNKEDVLRTALDSMHDQGMLGSRFHDQTGQVIPTAKLKDGISLNDIAYKQLNEQFDTYKAIKRDIGVQDAKTMHLLGGSNIAAHLIDLYAQRNKISAAMKSDKNGTVDPNTEEALRKNNDEIEYIQSGQARRHTVINAAIANEAFKKNPNQPPVISAQGIDATFKGMDDYMVTRKTELQQKADERNDFLTGGVDKQGTFANLHEQLKNLKPESFDDTAINMFGELAAKAAQHGTGESAKVAANTELDKHEAALGDIFDEETGFPKDTATPEQKKTFENISKARKLVDQVSQNSKEDISYDPEKEAENYLFTIEDKNADGTPRYNSIDNILSNIAAQDKLDDPSYAQQLRAVKDHLDNVVSPLLDHLDNVPSQIGEKITPERLKELQNYQAGDLPDHQGIGDRVQNLHNRIGELSQRYNEDAASRILRQIRLRKNHLLISYNFISRISSRIIETMSKDDGIGFKKQFDILQKLIYEGRRADQNDLVRDITDEQFSKIETQLITVESLLNKFFNSKAVDFDKFVEQAFKERLFETIGATDKRELGDYIHREYDAQPFDQIYSYAKFAADTNTLDQSEKKSVTYAKSSAFLNYMLNLKRVDAAAFYAIYDSYIEKLYKKGKEMVATDTGVIPSFEQEVNIRQAIGFLLSPDSSLIQKLMKENFKFFSENWLNNSLFYRGFAGAGKTTVSMKVICDLMRVIDPKVSFTVVSPNTKMLNDLNKATGATLGFTRNEFVSALGDPKKFAGTDILVIDESSTITSDQLANLKEIQKSYPGLRTIFLGDESQNVNVNDLGEVQALALHGIVEKTLPLTEVYRSGLVDLWKVQNYYRSQTQSGYSKFSQHTPPHVVFNPNTLEGVRFYGKLQRADGSIEKREDMIADFVAHVNADPTSNAILVVWDDPEKQTLLNSGMIKGDIADKIRTIRPQSKDDISGDSADKVWVDMTGVPAEAFNRAMLTAVTRGVNYVAAFDPAGTSLSTLQPIVRASESLQKKQVYLDALNSRLNNITSGNPVQSSLQKEVPEKKEKGKKEKKKPTGKRTILDILSTATELNKHPLLNTIFFTQKSDDKFGIIMGYPVNITRVLQDGPTIYYELNGDPYNLITGPQMLALQPSSNKLILSGLESQEPEPLIKAGFSSAVDFNGGSVVPIITFADYNVANQKGENNVSNRIKMGLLKYLEVNPDVKVYYEYMKSLPNGTTNVIVARVDDAYFDDFANSKYFTDAAGKDVVADPTQHNFVGVLSNPQFFNGNQWQSIFHALSPSAADILNVTEADLVKAIKGGLSQNDPYLDQIIQYQLFNLRLRKAAIHQADGADRMKLFNSAKFNLSGIKGASVLYKKVTDPGAVRTLAELRTSLKEKLGRNFLKMGNPYVRSVDVLDKNGELVSQQHMFVDVTYLGDKGVNDPNIVRIDLFMPLLTKETLDKLKMSLEPEVAKALKLVGNKAKASHKVIAINRSMLMQTLWYNQSFFTVNNNGVKQIRPEFAGLLTLDSHNRLDLTKFNKSADEQIRKLYAVFDKAFDMKLPLRESAQSAKGDINTSMDVEASHTRIQTRAYDVFFPQVKAVIDPSLVNTKEEAKTVTPQKKASVKNVIIKKVKRAHSKPTTVSVQEKRMSRDAVDSLLRRILGNEVVDSRVSFADQILDGHTELYGLMRNAHILLEDNSGIESSTPRHEALHFVLNYLVTKEQKDAILTEVKSLLGKTNPNVTDLMAEEWLANRYGKRYKGPVGVVSKFIDWLGRVFKRFGNSRYEFARLLADIEYGKFRDAEFQQSADTQTYRTSKKKVPGQLDESEESMQANRYTDYATMLNLFGEPQQMSNIRQGVADTLMQCSNFNKNLFTEARNQDQMILAALQSYKDDAAAIGDPDLFIDGVHITQWDQINSNNIDKLDDTSHENYISYRLGQEEVFYRFVKNIFQDYDVYGMRYLPLDSKEGLTTRELYEPGGEDTIGDDNEYKDVSGKLASFVRWITNMVQYTHPDDSENGEKRYINSDMLTSILPSVAGEAKGSGNINKLSDRQTAFANALKTRAEAGNTFTEVGNQLMAIYNEFYSRSSDKGAALYNLINGDAPVTVEALNEIFEEKTLQDGTVVPAMSHYQFINDQKIPRAIALIEGDSDVIDEKTGKPFPLNHITMLQYEAKRSASASLLSAFETHVMSLEPRTYGHIKLDKNSKKLNSSYKLKTQNSNFADDIKQQFQNALKAVLFGNDDYDLSKRPSIDAGLNSTYQDERRYTVTSNGLLDHDKQYLVEFTKDKAGKMSFKFGRRYTAANGTNIGAIKQAFKFLGLIVSPQAIKMMISNSQVFTQQDIYKRDLTGSDRLAEILGVMYIATMNAYHENSTNAKGGAQNPWYAIIKANPDWMPATENLSNEQLTDNNESTEEPEESPVVKLDEVYKPQDFWRHLEALSIAQSYAQSQGARNITYNADGKPVYFNLLSSSFWDKLGNWGLGASANRGLAARYENMVEDEKPELERYSPFYHKKLGILNPLLSAVKLTSGTFNIIRTVPFSFIRKFNGIPYTKMTERDYLDATLKTFINHQISQRFKKEQTMIMGWHTASDKSSVPWFEVNLGTDKLMNFDGTHMSVNKEMVLGNVRNLFHIQMRRLAIAQQDMMDFLKVSKTVHYNEDDVKNYRDAASFRLHLQTQFATMDPSEIKKSSLRLNYHYKINTDLNGKETVVPGNIYDDNNYNAENFNKIFATKYNPGTITDDQYKKMWKILFKKNYSAFSDYRSDVWKKLDANGKPLGGIGIREMTKQYWNQPQVDISTLDSNDYGTERWIQYLAEAKENHGLVTPSSPNPFVEAFFLGFHFTDSYVTPLVMGDAAQFKNIVDYFKRSSGPLAPGNIASTSNFEGIARTSKVAIVDDTRMTVQHSGLLNFFDHAAKVKETDGFSIYNFIFHWLLKNSVGPGQSAVPDAGMVKDVYNEVDPTNAFGLYLKKAALIPSETVYRNSTIIRSQVDQMLGEYLPLFQQTLETKGWKSAIETVARQVIADDNRENIVSQVVFLSAVKQGAHNITQPGDDFNPITIDNEHLRFQLNAEQDTEDEQIAVASQMAHQMSMGQHNTDRADQVYNALAQMINIEAEDIQSKIDEKVKSGYSEDEAFREYLRDLGIDQANSSGDIGYMIQFLRNKKNSTEVPFARADLMKLFINKFNKAIKPKLSGIRINQAPAMFETYEDSEGTMYTTDEVNRMSPEAKQALGVVPRMKIMNGQLVPSGLNHYKFLNEAGEEVTTKDQMHTIRTIKPVEIAVAFNQASDFGIVTQNLVNADRTFTKMQSLNDLYLLQDSKGNWINLAKDTESKIKMLVGAGLVTAESFPAYQCIQRIVNGHINTIQTRINELSSKDNAESRKLIEKLQAQQEQLRSVPINMDDIMDWYRKLEQKLDTYVARVPLNTTSSGFHARIAMFVHDSANTGFIPAEKNVLDDSDYDIDQLSLYSHKVNDPGYAGTQEIDSKLNQIKNAGNSIVAAMIDYYKDVRNIPFFMMPIDLAPIREIEGTKADISNSSSDITTSLQVRDKVLQGSYMISIFASSIKAYSQLVYASQHPEIGTVLTGIKLPNGQVDKDGQFIIKFLGQLLQLSTDNAKEMKLGEWSINPVTSNTVVAMAIQGYTPRQVIDFINDEDVANFFDDISRSQSINDETIDSFDYINSKIEKASEGKQLRKTYDQANKDFNNELEKSGITDEKILAGLSEDDKKVFETIKQANIAKYASQIEQLRNAPASEDSQKLLSKLKKLKGFLEDGQQMFRLARILAVGQGIKVFDFDLYQYINNAEFYLGQSLSDFLEGSDSNKAWTQMRGTNFTAEHAKDFKAIEKKVRGVFDLNKVVKTNKWYDAAIRSVKFIVDKAAGAFMQNGTSAQQILKENLDQQGTNYIHYKDYFYGYQTEFDRWMVSLFLDQYHNEDITMDGITTKIDTPQGRDVFMKYFPEWFKSQEALETNKNTATLFSQLTVNPSGTNNYLEFTNTHALTDENLLYLKKQFKSLPLDLQQKLYLYQMVKDGMKIKRGSLVEIMDEKLFEDYSQFLTNLHRNRDSLIRLSTGKQGTLVQLMRESFLPDLGTVNPDLLPSIGSLKNNAEDYKILPKFAKKQVSEIQMQVFRMKDGENDLHYYEPVNHVANVMANPYNPSQSGLTTQNTFKGLDVEKLKELYRNGKTTKSYVHKVMYDEGEYLLPDGSTVTLKKVERNEIELRLLNKRKSVDINEQASRIHGEKLNWLVRQLQKALPNLKVEFYDNNSIPENIGNNVKSYIENGTVFINTDKVTEDTATHEFAHLYVAILKETNPELYEQLKQQAEGSALFTELRKYDDYKNLSDDDYLQEVMSTMIGLKSVDAADRLYSQYQKANIITKFGDLIKSVYRSVNAWISDKLGLPGSGSTQDDLLTAVDRVAESLLGGKKLASLSDEQVRDLTDLRKYSIDPAARINTIDDFHKNLYEGFGITDKSSAQQANIILGDVLAKGVTSNGKYVHNGIPLNGTTDAELLSEIRNKVLPAQEQQEHMIKDGVIGLVKTSMDSKAAFGMDLEQHVIDGIKERVDFQILTDDIFRLDSPEAREHFRANAMEATYSEMLDKFKGFNPILVVHGSKNTDPSIPKQYSLIDFTRNPLKKGDKFSQMNMMFKFLSDKGNWLGIKTGEIMGNSLGIKLRNSEGGHRMMALALTALKMHMANPKIQFHNIDVVSMPGSKKIMSEFVYMPDMLKQLRKFTKLKGFMQMLGPDMKAVYDHANKIADEDFDQSYITSMYRLYKTNAMSAEEFAYQKMYENYANEVVSWMGGKTSNNDMVDWITDRMYTIEDGYRQDDKEDDWLDHKEHKYLSGLLKELTSAKTLGRSIMRDLTGVGRYLKGNMRVNNEVVQWSVQQIKNNLNWVSNTLMAYKQEFKPFLRDLVKEYYIQHPGIQYDIIREHGTDLFKNLLDTKEYTVVDTGEKRTVPTGYIHFDETHEDTKLAIAAGRFRKVGNVYPELECGKFIVKTIREGFISQLMHQQGLTLDAATKKYSLLWKDGMIPYLKKSVSGQLFHGDVAGAIANFFNEYTKGDAIFENSRDQDEEKWKIGDKFMYQLGGGLYGSNSRTELLGFDYDEYTGEIKIKDQKANDNFDTNLERVLDYFQAWNIRKKRLDNVLLPRLNAAKSLLYNYANSRGAAMKHNIEFLDDLKDRLILGHMKRTDTWMSAQGLNFSLDNVLNSTRTAINVKALAFNVPLAIMSGGQNLLHMISTSVSNYFSDGQFFNFQDLSKAVVEIGTPGSFQKIMRLVNQMQITNMDERSLVSNPLHKHGLQKNFLFQGEYAYWGNFSTDYLTRATVMISQMIHDGSWDAYTTDKNGDLHYDESKDKRWQGTDGKLMKAHSIQTLIDEGIMTKDDKVMPRGYGFQDSRRIKEFTDMHIIGSMDPTVQRGAAAYSIGKMFMQFHNYAMDKVEDLYTRPYPNDAMSYRRIVKNDKGEDEVIWQKMMMEGKLNTLFYMIGGLTRVRNQGFNAWSEMTPFQKRNLAALSMDVIMYYVLYSAFRFLLRDKKDDKDEMGWWDASFSKVGAPRLYRTLDYTLQDLIWEWNGASFKTLQQPLPVVNQLIQVSSIFNAMVHGDMGKAGMGMLKKSPGGATGEMIYDILNPNPKK